MTKIGIVGAGTMGSGIAAVSALAGYDVSLSDNSPPALTASRVRIESDLRKSVTKGKLTDEGFTHALQRISFEQSVDSLSGCGIVIECAVENLGIKQNIFAELGRICGAETLLATNTSSLPVTTIASGVTERSRVIGLHFFNPPLLMKLVEVIRGEQSGESFLQQGVAFVQTLGKTAVLVRDTPGFIVNRVARPFYGEALKILGEGIATVEQIDRIVTSEGGFKMGPFELMDLIGIDVNLAVTASMYEQTYGEPRYRPHIIQQQMVASGHLGRKTGKGFYTYPR